MKLEILPRKVGDRMKDTSMGQLNPKDGFLLWNLIFDKKIRS